MEKFEQRQRRWLAKVDMDAVSLAPKATMGIWQGYLPTSAPNELMRIRYVPSLNRAFCTIKNGQSSIRLVSQIEIYDTNFAQFLLRHSISLKKDRYEMPDGWQVDILQSDNLKGLVIVEKRLSRFQETIKFPAWMLEMEDITDTTSNYELAVLAQYKNANREELTKFIKIPPAPVFVLDGGPGSAKTTITARLKEKNGQDFWVHKEMATNLILEMDHAPHATNPNSIKTAVFEEDLDRIQAILELSASKQAAIYGKKAVIVDRGRPGIACYYPDYETRCAKLQDIYPMYRAVIILDLPPKEIWEKIQKSNPARQETYEQAVELAQKVEEPWLKPGHPPIVRIPFFDNIDDKLNAVEQTINQYL